MRFHFEAKTKVGKLEKGYVDASGEDAAAAFLQKNGLFPVRIVAEGSRGDSIRKTFSKYFDKIAEKDLVVFFRQLAILIEAKVPIVTALVAVSEQTTSAYFRAVISDIRKDVEDGMTFSDALSRHQDVFSELSINIIKAGELSGGLRKSVEYVADNIEKNYNLANKIKSALIYPAIVMVVFFIIGFLVITIIIPKLTVMIKELEAEVPWYTKLLIDVGDFMSQYWWATLIIFFGFIGAIIYYLKTPGGKKEWDQVKINLPVIGLMFRYVYITRFSENLAVLLVGGIPIVKALTIISSVIGNSLYEDLFLRLAESVKGGDSMSDVLRKSPLFPPMVSHMVKIGEDSGQVDLVLGHIARFYGQEVDLMAKNMSTLIEPVLMIIIGLGVGFIAVGVLMPIYNIAGQIH